MSNWWADRLSKQTAGNTPPTAVSQAGGPSQNPYSQAIPTGNLQKPARLLPKHSEETCPGCNSGNYMSAPGSTWKRCYDCGYPLVQAGSGVGTTKSDTPTKRATQVEGGGFNPKQIVGRVDG
jgi:hypothetical protein